jgi:hypothetical protein
MYDLMNFSDRGSFAIIRRRSSGVTTRPFALGIEPKTIAGRRAPKGDFLRPTNTFDPSAR